MKHHKRKAKIIQTHHEQILFWKAGNREKSVLELVGKYLQIADKLRIEAKRNLLISAQTKYVGRKRLNVQLYMVTQQIPPSIRTETATNYTDAQKNS